jgi:hypothetical protein
MNTCSAREYVVLALNRAFVLLAAGDNSSLATRVTMAGMSRGKLGVCFNEGTASEFTSVRQSVTLFQLRVKCHTLYINYFLSTDIPSVNNSVAY